MRRALFGAIAIAGLLPALLDFAMAEEKDFIFNGTGIHALLDQDQGVAIFSNGCGTQTLTLQQLQAGETPSNILPCSTSGGTTAPGPDNPEPCRAGQSEIQCKCSQRADALGLHGEARWTFRANCKAEMKAGPQPRFRWRGETGSDVAAKRAALGDKPPLISWRLFCAEG